MLKRIFPVASLVGCALCLIAVLLTAAPQDGVDRERYAREYVQFLLLQLDQWTKGFPHDYNLALMKPPVDATKLSEPAKAGANLLREQLLGLSALAEAPNVLKNREFAGQLTRALGTAKFVNEAMGSQRFPGVLQSDWDQIRSNLNNLARIFEVEQLAVLEAPGGGGRGGRGGRGQQAAAATAAVALPAGASGLVGYVVDKQCAIRGKGMWVNAECVARCLRDGDKVVLVTEEGKVYSIANPDKIEPETYGQKIALVGKVDGESITVATR